MYSTIRPQTSVKKGLFSSLHGLLISIHGLKKITTWSQVYGSQDRQRSATLNFRWMNFYSPSYFLASANTFPEFFPKGDLLCQERRYLRAFLMIASSFIHRIFKFTGFLGSACSHRTCDHVVILFKRAEWNQWPMKRAKKIPPFKKRLRSILTMIVGRETNGIISWVVNFRVRVM